MRYIVELAPCNTRKSALLASSSALVVFSQIFRPLQDRHVNKKEGGRQDVDRSPGQFPFFAFEGCIFL